MKTIEDLEKFCLHAIDDGYGKSFMFWDEREKEALLSEAFSEYAKKGKITFRSKYVRESCYPTFE